MRSTQSCSYPTQLLATMTVGRSRYSYIGVNRHCIGFKKTVDIAFEQNPILYRVDASVRLIGGRNSDPTTVFKIIPVLLVCQRKYMSDFEGVPTAKVR